MVATPPSNNNNRSRAGNKTRRTLIEAELVSSVAWLIRLRWFAGAGVILVTWIVSSILNLNAPDLRLILIGIGILLYNLVFFLTERRLTRESAPAASFQRLAIWQLTLDWLAMTFLIHCTGGIESPVTIFFIFHIILASIFFPPRMAYAFALLAIVLLGLIAVLEYYSILPHEQIGGYLEIPLYQNKIYVLAQWIFFSSTALIAAYLATTISERLRMREEEVVTLTESLQRASNRMRVLNEGARSINSTLELKQVLDSLVKNMSEVMGVRACSIRLLDKTGMRLEPVATYGLSQAYLDKGPVELDNNPLAREILAGKLVHIPSVTESSLLQYPDWAVLEGIHSMLSAPLIGKSGPLGILRVYSEEMDHFTPDDEAFLTAIAAQGSIAIENAMAYQAMETLDATKSDFIRIVTHELRSPVSVIRSLLRTIVVGYAGEVNQQQRDILERASRRSDYLQKLIDDLLDLAAGKVEFKSREAIEPVSLDEIVLQVIKRFEVPANDKGLSLEWRNKTGESPSKVMGNAEMLDRVFNNLVSNAVKYTPLGGIISVTLSHVGSEAWVAVEDSGIGIPDEALPHLFEEFYRAPNAKEVEREGTGLGLTIVKDMVTRFGGRISVQSTLGEGTTFTVMLPLIESTLS